jgi:type II secretory pathway component GspD/PulD (secretin)
MPLSKVATPLSYVSNRRPLLSLRYFCALLTFAIILNSPCVLAQSPSTAPATQPTPASIDDLLPKNRAVLDFSDQSLADIVDAVNKSYGLKIIDPFKLQDHVTMKIREPMSARDAISILDQTLIPLGYTVLAEVRGNPPALQLRISTTTTQRGVPVYSGGDSASIPLGDNLRTQVIPLVAIDPDRARETITPVLDKSADIVINNINHSLIITDTATHIHTAAALIEVLEKQAAATRSAPR